MTDLLELIKRPWPWWISGPLIGLTVPILLLSGNKKFGISSSLRHICAVVFPSNISFFKYDWKKEIWNLFFVAGIVIGACIAVTFLSNHTPMQVNPKLTQELSVYGITNYDHLAPGELFNWHNLLTVKGFIVMIIGGFFVGFGTRYAGGCTSGHSIMGMSNLQWPSLVATICFMVGGFIMADLIMPFILKL
ncbi:MAG: YeeE/YedE thiosulfate transporter family protein [Chitinophagaceae bacterium]